MSTYDYSPSVYGGATTSRGGGGGGTLPLGPTATSSPPPTSSTAQHRSAIQEGQVLRRLCRQNNARLVGEMLDAGVSVDQPQGDGCTGLWLACEAGSLDVVRVLLAHGANPQATKPSGNISAVFIAAQNGHAEIVEELMDHGASVSTAKTTGATPLFIAAQQGHEAVVETLLRGGAGHSIPTASGVTPLIIAAHQGNVGVIRRLLAAGADPNARAQGKTAVEWAAENRFQTEVENAILDQAHASRTEGRRRKEVELSSAPLVSRAQHHVQQSGHHNDARSDAGHTVGRHTTGGASSASGGGRGGPARSARSASSTGRAAAEAASSPALAVQQSIADRSASAAGRRGYTDDHRNVNTRSFSAPLGKDVGNMQQHHAASSSVQPHDTLSARPTLLSYAEQEARRSAAFRSSLRRETVPGKHRQQSEWHSGDNSRSGLHALERDVFATEQEWRSLRRRLEATDENNRRFGIEMARLPDPWMYGPEAMDEFAARQAALQRERAAIAKENAAQTEATRAVLAEGSGSTVPALSDERTSRLEEFLSKGRGAQGPPAPLPPSVTGGVSSSALRGLASRTSTDIGLFALPGGVTGNGSADDSAAAAPPPPTNPAATPTTLSALERLRLRQQQR